MLWISPLVFCTEAWSATNLENRQNWRNWPCLSHMSVPPHSKCHIQHMNSYKWDWWREDSSPHWILECQLFSQGKTALRSTRTSLWYTRKTISCLVSAVCVMMGGCMEDLIAPLMTSDGPWGVNHEIMTLRFHNSNTRTFANMNATLMHNYLHTFIHIHILNVS